MSLNTVNKFALKNATVVSMNQTYVISAHFITMEMQMKVVVYHYEVSYS